MTVHELSVGDGHTLDVADLVAGFSDEISEGAAQFESDGGIPADLARRMAGAGFFRFCNPADYGGPGRSPRDYALLVEGLARCDGSTGWVVFIGITSALAACKLEADVLREILAKPETITAGVFAPSGRALPCEQDGQRGFLLNGRWQWGSGSGNADYISAGAFIVGEDGEMQRRADGSPEQRSLLMPIGDVELLDTWHVSGLKATGSTDFVARDVFVPEARVSDPFAPSAGDDPMHSFPFFAALGIGIGAVALGLAQACLDEFLSLAGQKTPQGSARTLAMKSATHRRVAEATARLRSARLYFFDRIDHAWETACRGEGVSVADRAELRLSNTHAVMTASEVIDSLYTLAGGSSVYLKSPLQRHFRDVHVATQHMMVNEATLELVGRVQLGLETNTAML